MTLRYLNLWLLALALLGAPLRAAAAPAEMVTDFQQQAALSRSGTLEITQTIDYDFGFAASHPVSFSIPLNYHDDQGREFRMSFSLSHLTVDGQAVVITPAVTTETARLTLPAGSGTGPVRKYILNYRLSPVVLRGLDSDILKLNVTGLTWSVPIQKAALQLTTPVAPADSLTCYAGAAGSTTGRCSVDQQGNLATVTSFAPLQPGEGLSVYANFPSRSFDAYLQAYEAHPSSIWRQAAEFVGGVVAVTLVCIGLAAWYRRRYTKINETAQDQADR